MFYNKEESPLNKAQNNRLILNDYLIIENFGDDKSEYKVRLNISEKEFLSLLKNKIQVFLDTSILKNSNIEMINCIGAYVNQYLSSYHDMCIYIPYLKYSRQERKTYDDCDQLTPYLNSILYFNTIYTIYLHNKLYKHTKKRILEVDVQYRKELTDMNLIFADNGLITYASTIKNIFGLKTCSLEFECFEKKRNGNVIITELPKNFIANNNKKYLIIDDIIAGGQTMINAINLLKFYTHTQNIHIATIYMMSDYSINQLLANGILLENIHYIYKVNN